MMAMHIVSARTQRLAVTSTLIKYMGEAAAACRKQHRYTTTPDIQNHRSIVTRSSVVLAQPVEDPAPAPQ
ncbi:hypothetical protein J6590_092730, partial [Homalodisca vitripennis]